MTEYAPPPPEDGIPLTRPLPTEPLGVEEPFADDDPTQVLSDRTTERLAVNGGADPFDPAAVPISPPTAIAPALTDTAPALTDTAPAVTDTAPALTDTASALSETAPAEAGSATIGPVDAASEAAAPPSTSLGPPPPPPTTPPTFGVTSSGEGEPRLAARPVPGTELPSRWNLGRILRRFAGADEELLAWVPQERSRYTGMGGAVLFTAVMAFMSMTVALGLAFDTRSPVILIPALVWFVLILNFDRWLVSAPLSKSFWRKVPMIAVRMGMAFLFGVVIAEPLVLAVFNTAVKTEVLQLRADDLKKYGSQWERCNPLDLTNQPAGTSTPSATPTPTPSGSTGTATAAADPTCADFIVPLPENVRALRNDFTAKQAQLVSLQATLKPLIAQHDKLVKKSQDECLGRPGVGLTGQFGAGPVCKRLTQDAVNYAKLNRLDDLQKNVASLTDSLTALSTQIRDASTKWADQRSAYIADQVAQRKASEGKIGLLERIEALNTLAVTHTALGTAIWAVRALFILVDLAPALLKLTSGTTRYDRLVDAQLRLGEVQFAATTRAAMARAKRWSADDRADLDVERARLAGERTAEYDRIMDHLEGHWAAAAEAADSPAERVGVASSARGWPMSGSRYTYDPEAADREDY